MSSSPPDKCDYLVIGAGATGMAFVDSLLQGIHLENKNAAGNSKDTPMKIVLMDQHATPGGQWHDSYNFVRLHQPSAMYGVESTKLEPSAAITNTDTVEEKHRATRQEILDYYAALVQKWESNNDSSDGVVSFQFVGNATLAFETTTKGDDDNNNNEGQSYQFQSKDNDKTTTTHTIQVTKRLVDARYLQPDLPINTAPKFDFDASKINCVPVNEIVVGGDESKPAVFTNASTEHFVVIGAGKTGMDAVVYLLTQKKVSPFNILWIVPHDPWITARENIGNCMEFLHDATQVFKQQEQSSNNQDMQSTELVQATFKLWEEQGKIYRLFTDTTALPTKFNDATLSKEELAVIRSLPSEQVIRGSGRVASIDSETGALGMQNGSNVALPWTNNSTKTTTYVHCSAGAFNYTKQVGVTPKPIFDTTNQMITLQDVYGTPGFCFVGSILGKLESLSVAGILTDDQKNDLCQFPDPSSAAAYALGPSGGDVGGLSKDHGWVQRLGNVKMWLETPQLRNWLVGHRLFNLGHYTSADDMEKLVNETTTVLKEAGLVKA